MTKRFDPHIHTMYSNIRLLDAINRPKDLINRAIELGLSGVAITDHECLASHMEVNMYANTLKEKNPDFKVALGNEIYLCENRENGQRYYHFILIAKNKKGHKALRILSSRAWMNSWYDRGMERVVTTYDDLKEIVSKFPGCLIATSACLGGELSVQTNNLNKCEIIGDQTGATNAQNRIVDFVLFCKELFGEDFYIECAPAASKDQIDVNKRLVKIAECFQVKMVIGSDAHYLRKEDRFVHKAYLNSKGGEREVDDFYEYAYLQDEDEVRENIAASIPEMYDDMIATSEEIYNKIEVYSLEHRQVIPTVDVKDYPKDGGLLGYPTLHKLLMSDDIQDRYWINNCLEALEDKNLWNPTYLARLEEEADIKSTISEKLGTNMFSYPNTLQHYINMFWECGSIVGAGRGSSCSGLNHYLLGITQLDPIKWELPFWRYLNKERVELGSLLLILPSCK